MEKRLFLRASVLGAASGAAVLPGLARARTESKTTVGPTLLTVSGMIGPGNRGALDPALDQLMSKQKVEFNTAHAFDFSALTALPAVTIRPTLEYDNKTHTLQGPLLSNVMKTCGVEITEKTIYLLRAIDGYVAQISAADASKYRFIVATHLDGHPMGLGGLGPLWAVYDADRFPEMAAKPVNQRFAACPWATYHIEVSHR